MAWEIHSISQLQIVDPLLVFPSNGFSSFLFPLFLDVLIPCPARRVFLQGFESEEAKRKENEKQKTRKFLPEKTG